jgi:hypothetical protein
MIDDGLRIVHCGPEQRIVHGSLADPTLGLEDLQNAVERFAVLSNGEVDRVEQVEEWPIGGRLLVTSLDARLAYVEGRFGGDAGSGRRKAASADAPWIGRCAAGLRHIAGSTITFAPIVTRS